MESASMVDEIRYLAEMAQREVILLCYDKIDDPSQAMFSPQSEANAPGPELFCLVHNLFQLQLSRFKSDPVNNVHPAEMFSFMRKQGMRGNKLLEAARSHLAAVDKKKKFTGAEPEAVIKVADDARDGLNRAILDIKSAYDKLPPARTLSQLREFCCAKENGAVIILEEDAGEGKLEPAHRDVAADEGKEEKAEAEAEDETKPGPATRLARARVCVLTDLNHEATISVTVINDVCPQNPGALASMQQPSFYTSVDLSSAHTTFVAVFSNMMQRKVLDPIQAIKPAQYRKYGYVVVEKILAEHAPFLKSPQPLSVIKAEHVHYCTSAAMFVWAVCRTAIANDAAEFRSWATAVLAELEDDKLPLFRSTLRFFDGLDMVVPVRNALKNRVIMTPSPGKETVIGSDVHALCHVGLLLNGLVLHRIVEAVAPGLLDETMKTIRSDYREKIWNMMQANSALADLQRREQEKLVAGTVDDDEEEKEETPEEQEASGRHRVSMLAREISSGFEQIRMIVVPRSTRRAEAKKKDMAKIKKKGPRPMAEGDNK